MAFQLSFRPQTLTKLRRIRPLSSFTPPDSSADISSAAVPDPSSAVAAAAPPPPPSCASPSSDIEDRLFKKNHLDKPSFAAADDPKRTAQSLDSIRESLRKFPGVQPPKSSFRGLYNLISRFTAPIKPDQLPGSIFGKEKPNLTSRFTPPIKPDQLPGSIFGKEKPTDDTEPKAPKTVKELGEKLRRLFSEVGDNRLSFTELKDRLKFRELEKKVGDSIAELNDRLLKFRKVAYSIAEMEEKVADSIAEMEEKVADSITELNELRELEEKVKLREADSIPAPSLAGKNPPTMPIRRLQSRRRSRLRSELGEKVADSIFELNDRLVKLRELEEKVADSIAELNERLVKLREMEEKVADSIPSSIFDKEKPSKPTDDAYPKAPKWEKELREKLRWLRCKLEEKMADSIAELNDRLVKLCELEERVADSITGSIFGKEKPIPKWEKELVEKLRLLCSEMKLRKLEEKVTDSIAKLNYRLVKLCELEEKVADSIAELNGLLVKFPKMEEKVADSRMGGESLVGPLGNPLQGQGG